MEDEIYLTPEGAQKLRRELEELRAAGRQELADRLRHAVSQGDLSENADYLSAKEDQAFLEGRIRELEVVLEKATIVDRMEATGQVQVGSVVVVTDENQTRSTYSIVGAKEADPAKGKISHLSPIGKALMGREVGDTFVAETPGGEIRLEVVELR